MPSECRIRFSLAGWFWAGTCLLLLVGGVLTGCVPVAAWALALLAVLGAMWLLAWVNIMRLVCRVCVPERAVAGQVFPVDITLINRWRCIPGMFYRFRDFATPQMVQGSPVIRCLAAGDSLTMEGEAMVAKRGIYRMFGCEIDSSFPLGLFAGRLREQVVIRLVVVPRPRSIERIRKRFLHRSFGAGQVQDEWSTPDGEFRALRDYRHGDSPKLICWPVSTRHFNPVVRELENPFPQRVRLFFHRHRPQGKVIHSRMFEQSLEMLSGILVLVRMQHWECWFWSDLVEMDQPLLLAGRTPHLVDEMLACAAMDFAGGFDRLIEQVASRTGSGGLTLVLSNCPCRYWEARVAAVCSDPLICLDPGAEDMA